MSFFHLKPIKADCFLSHIKVGGLDLKFGNQSVEYLQTCTENQTVRYGGQRVEDDVLLLHDLSQVR